MPDIDLFWDWGLTEPSRGGGTVRWAGKHDPGFLNCCCHSSQSNTDIKLFTITTIIIKWDWLLSMLCRLSMLCLLVTLSTPATWDGDHYDQCDSKWYSWRRPTLFFFCEQSFGILKTQRLWKLSPQYSHLRPCLNIPNSISPQKLKVGDFKKKLVYVSFCQICLLCHCTMTQAMKIEAIKIFKSTKLIIHTHFLPNQIIVFANGVKLT